MTRLFAAALVCLLACCGSSHTNSSIDGQGDLVQPTQNMQLGNFSVSLAVKDLSASRAFYEKLGFRAIGGDPAQNWLILQNDTSTIGLFQGMFERNTLTFNPGWNRSGETLARFDDVRDIQRVVVERGLQPATPADETTTGPASFMLIDPDGNPILIDQHVPRATN